MDFAMVKNRDGSRGAKPPRPILAEDRVRYAGEAMAMVVAETPAAALDAAEMIVFDLEDLPVHVATAVGRAADAPPRPRTTSATTGRSATRRRSPRPSRRRRTPRGWSSSTTG